jgi:peptide/nickel transport system permease protein
MALLNSDKNDKKVREAERIAADAAKAQTAERAGGKKRAQSYWAVSWNIFKKNKLGMACLFVVGLLVLVAILAPVLAPFDPDAQELSNMLAAPGGAHVFGTDEFGRDIFIGALPQQALPENFSVRFWIRPEHRVDALL